MFVREKTKKRAVSLRETERFTRDRLSRRELRERGFPRIAVEATRYLDPLERWWLRRTSAVTRERIRNFVPQFERLVQQGVQERIEVPGFELQNTLNEEMVLRAWVWGMLTAQADIQNFRQPETSNFMGSDPPNLEFDGPLPRAAAEWLDSRRVLLGKWSRDLDDQVSAVISRAVSTGASLDRARTELNRIFPDFSRSRLENIVRTETTAAINQGRLDNFRQPGSRVAALQYVAILDGRTTNICRSRDGMILLIDDPRVAENTPPLHFNCRSVWTPVSEFDLEDLRAGDPDVEETFFGFLPSGAPTSLREAMGRVGNAERPLPGFGRVGAPRRRTPSRSPSPGRVTVSNIEDEVGSVRVRDRESLLGVTGDLIASLVSFSDDEDYRRRIGLFVALELIRRLLSSEDEDE